MTGLAGRCCAGTPQTLIPDLQGSVLATLDSSTGALTKRGYLPYGASVTGSFAYAGQRIDPETSGLYYARPHVRAWAWSIPTAGSN